ncbi:MAG TPA: hypothetical protein VHO92_00820 [Methanobacterium sp.]|nr:hypothetical protein [Methanobacterium sp.]
MNINKVRISIIGIILCIAVVFAYFYMPYVHSTSSKDYFNSLEVSPADASYIVVGSSYIIVPEHAKVVTQVDRVIRDKLSHYNDNISVNHQPTSYKQLVPWMEGERVGELMKYANITVIPATNVTVKKIDGRYFGPDDHGNFVFEVDPSKISSVYSKKINNDTWVEIDTHGMNVMVPEAIKDHAYLVIACGDLYGKAKAEAYMAEQGINCYAPCDRFTSSIMGYNGSGTILGGAAIRPLKNGQGAIIGGQPLYFSTKEKIVVQTTTKRYPDQYCDTPNRYFKNLQQKYGIKLDVDVVDASIGESGKVVAEAEKTGANVIGVRVLNQKDKKPVEKWLKENKNHRAILFHSAAYDPGYSLFFEFPHQVTGQDPDPKFIGNVSNSQIQNDEDEIRGLWDTNQSTEDSSNFGSMFGIGNLLKYL